MSRVYDFQRAMRAVRKAALQRGVVAVLDVGTSKIACLVLKLDERQSSTVLSGTMAAQARMQVIGVANTRSRGVRYGEISDMRETELAIRTVIQAAQKMAGLRVDHVLVCFSGAAPRSYGVQGEVDLPSRLVEQDDIGRVLAACDVPDYGPGREVLHAQPVNFTLDNRSGILDPRGQMGQALSTDVHLLTIEASVVQNIVRAIRNCDLELAGLVSSAYVSGLSSLVEDELELGAACIDIGGGSTGVSIFAKKHMIYAESVRMGGDHITSDISLGLQMPLVAAERIKTFYGGVVATGMDDRDMIEIGGNTGDWERDSRTVSRAELIGIMRPRVEEILEEVRNCLDAAGFGYLPSRQIVLTGGSSQIPGLDGLASRFLGQQVRMGRPMRISGLPQAAAGAPFSSAVGLCLSAAKPQDEWWDFDVPAERYPTHSLKRAVRWFRDNW